MDACVVVETVSAWATTVAAASTPAIAIVVSSCCVVEVVSEIFCVTLLKPDSEQVTV